MVSADWLENLPFGCHLDKSVHFTQVCSARLLETKTGIRHIEVLGILVQVKKENLSVWKVGSHTGWFPVNTCSRDCGGLNGW